MKKLWDLKETVVPVIIGILERVGKIIIPIIIGVLKSIGIMIVTSINGKRGR